MAMASERGPAGRQDVLPTLPPRLRFRGGPGLLGQHLPVRRRRGRVQRRRRRQLVRRLGTGELGRRLQRHPGPDLRWTRQQQPAGGPEAYIGDSHGYWATRINVSALAGKTVRFRFRIGTDYDGARLRLVHRRREHRRPEASAARGADAGARQRPRRRCRARSGATSRWRAWSFLALPDPAPAAAPTTPATAASGRWRR